ncbi:MAG: hypothetical protein Q6364_01935 [Candidatus Hermodarchaeota archaeon]|nr:hypothetical protein [Candidatus Hermodarchaeota archaeon]
MVNLKSFQKVRKALEKIGLPGQDAYDLPTSEKRFPDGAGYRIEISGVERPQVLEALIDESEKRGIPVHRLISVVMGATFLDDKELRQFAKMAYDAQMEVILTPGPRTSWDIGRQLVTPDGALSGMRFRGADKLVEVITDINRGIELGFRGFLVIDEGLLWTLNKLKEIGEIPKDIMFKVSIFAGHASPAGGKLLEELGAGSFNPVADMSVPQLAAIRQATDFPIDIHIILMPSFGGFNRFYDSPEITRCVQPVYYKFEPGPSMALYTPWSSVQGLSDLAREKVKWAEIVRNIIQDNYPEAKLSKLGPKDLAIPKP